MIEEVVKLKEDLETRGIKGLALDIDETLSWTVGYWFEEMQKVFGNPEGLSPREMANKYHFTQNIPYYQTEEAKAWMAEKIKDNELQKNLPVIEGAVETVYKINMIIPIVAYLTIRPQSVIEGTKFWLDKNMFPSAPIIARPEDISKSEGHQWKASVLEYLHPYVGGIIDDNIIISEYLSDNYQGTIFAYGNNEVHESKIKIIACPKWEDVEKEIAALRSLHGGQAQ